MKVMRDHVAPPGAAASQLCNARQEDAQKQCSIISIVIMVTNGYGIRPLDFSLVFLKLSRQYSQSVSTKVPAKIILWRRASSI